MTTRQLLKYRTHPVVAPMRAEPSLAFALMSDGKLVVDFESFSIHRPKSFSRLDELFR